MLVIFSGRESARDSVSRNGFIGFVARVVALVQRVYQLFQCTFFVYHTVQVLQAKRKTWTFWKNLRDGALNYIADMHAKRRQLLWHTKARLVQNVYRAHLARMRSRGVPVIKERDFASVVAVAVENSKSGSAFQQKRLPSKALDIRKRKSVLPSASVIIASAASSSPALITNERRDSTSDSPPPLPLPLVPESTSLGNRARLKSM